MLHFVFTAATWLIGTLGVAGAGAAVAATVFLGPAAVLGIVGPMVSKFVGCGKCVAVTVFVLSTVGAYWVGHHGEYHRGYSAAIAAIAAEDETAISSATEQRKVWRDCKAKNGQWDQSTGSCQ